MMQSKYDSSIRSQKPSKKSTGPQRILQSRIKSWAGCYHISDFKQHKAEQGTHSSAPGLKLKSADMTRSSNAFFCRQLTTN